MPDGLERERRAPTGLRPAVIAVVVQAALVAALALGVLAVTVALAVGTVVPPAAEGVMMADVAAWAWAWAVAPRSWACLLLFWEGSRARSCGDAPSRLALLGGEGAPPPPSPSPRPRPRRPRGIVGGGYDREKNAPKSRCAVGILWTQESRSRATERRPHPYPEFCLGETCTRSSNLSKTGPTKQAKDLQNKRPSKQPWPTKKISPPLSSTMAPECARVS